MTFWARGGKQSVIFARGQLQPGVVVAAGLSKGLELTRKTAMCSCGVRKGCGTGGYQSCDGGLSGGRWWDACLVR